MNFKIWAEIKEGFNGNKLLFTYIQYNDLISNIAFIIEKESKIEEILKYSIDCLCRDLFPKPIRNNA